MVVTGLSSSTTYHFKVTSEDSSGNSASSADLTFTTTSPAPPAALSVDLSAPTSEDQGVTFEVEAIITNTGSSTAAGVKTTIMVPDGLSIIGSTMIPIGDIAAEDEAEVIWEVSAVDWGLYTITVTTVDSSGSTTSFTAIEILQADSD